MKSAMKIPALVVVDDGDMRVWCRIDWEQRILDFYLNSILEIYRFLKKYLVEIT